MSENSSRIERAVLSQATSRTLVDDETALCRQRNGTLRATKRNFVYDGATAEFRDICNYWKAENMGVVTAKFDEQKTEETKQKVAALAGKL